VSLPGRGRKIVFLFFLPLRQRFFVRLVNGKTASTAFTVSSMAVRHDDDCDFFHRNETMAFFFFSFASLHDLFGSCVVAKSKQQTTLAKVETMTSNK
jgi:hypothetical protein